MNLIFDWSGTLCNDFNYSWDITNKVLSKLNYRAITLEEYKQHFQIPLSGFYKIFASQHTMKEIDSLFFPIYHKYTKKLNLYPKAKNFLINAKKQNDNIYILSTVNTKTLEKVTKELGIENLFTKIYGDAYNKKKFLPNIIKKHEMKPWETIFFGDTIHDIETGKENRIQSAGVTYGYSHPSKLNKAYADYYFNSFNEIQKWHQQKKIEESKIPISTVGGFVINSEKKILLVQTEKWSDLWGTPGGKIQYGETLKEAFIREIKEETGLTIDKVKHIITQDSIEDSDFYTPKHFILINYIGYTQDTSVHLNYELKNYCWVTLEEAEKIKLNKPSKILLKAIKNKI